MKFSDFKEKRKFALKNIVPTLEKFGFAEKAEKIKMCGYFKRIAVCQSCGTWHFNGVESCRDRLCPVCQKKRSLLWFSKLAPLFRDYLGKGYYICMINLTIRDTVKLADGVNLIQDAFRYLTGKNHKTANEFKCRFIGGIRSLEIKKGKNSGLWHPHCHCLAVKYKFGFDYDWLCTEWNNALCVVTGLYGQKIGSVFLSGIQGNNLQELYKSICEVMKYMTKFDWKDIGKDLPELIETMANRRSISTWGCVRHMLRDYDAEDEMDLNLTDIKERICSTCGNNAFDLIDGVGGNYLQLSDFANPEEDYNEIYNNFEE